MNGSTITRINHVDLSVRNLDASVAFYCGLFGLTARPTDPPSLLTRQCLVGQGDALGGFGFVLTQGLGTGTEPSGVDHISLEVRALEDVVRLYRKARALQARATEPRIYEGHWQFFVFDPDGYKIEVMAAQSPTTAAEPAHTRERESSK